MSRRETSEEDCSMTNKEVLMKFGRKGTKFFATMQERRRRTFPSGEAIATAEEGAFLKKHTEKNDAEMPLPCIFQ